MTITCSLTVAGISFTLLLPDESWLLPLQARYASFLSPSSPGWTIILDRYPADSFPVPGDRVVHEDLRTNYQVGRTCGSIDLAARRADVAVLDPAVGGMALDRTMSFVLMQELPRYHEALLLHGVAVVRNGYGLAHSGRSGVGKTTTARLAAGYAEVLVDENLIVSVASRQPALLSTPFWGASTPPEMIHRVNRQVPLRALLLPEHGTDFVLEPLSQPDAVLALLTTEKIAVERVSSAGAWLETAQKLVMRVPTYRFYFRPDPAMWAFLDNALAL
ncbi:MAG: hypothetical protein ABTQ73_04530 [Caldilineales bacterium]